MTDDIREMGPIDWLLIEFDGPLTGRAAGPLNELAQQGTIRILDIAFLRRFSDGAVQAVDIAELPGEESVRVSIFDGLSSGILGDEDLHEAGKTLSVDSRAVLLVYENVWAAPFAVAVREAGGTLVDSGRIPVQAIVAALDEVDALEAEQQDS